MVSAIFFYKFFFAYSLDGVHFVRFNPPEPDAAAAVDADDDDSDFGRK